MQKAFTGARVGAAARPVPAARRIAARRTALAARAGPAAAEGDMVDELGFKLMRKGVKVAAADSILTPRCVTGRETGRARPPPRLRARPPPAAIRPDLTPPPPPAQLLHDRL
jgi:hypothetical protein